MKEDLQRVFIHELGHFIAAELNFILYDFDRRIIEMKLEPRLGTKFYNGSVRNDKPMDDNYHPKNTSKEYAQTFYGCLFECLFRKIDINDCLKNSVTREEHLITNIGNGKIDALYIYSYAQRKEIKKVSHKWYEYVTSEFFNSMKVESLHFQEIFSIEIEDFILDEINGTFFINLLKLHSACQFFITEHKHIYSNLIAKLESIQ